MLRIISAGKTHLILMELQMRSQSNLKSIWSLFAMPIDLQQAKYIIEIVILRLSSNTRMADKGRVKPD